ncbi:MAG: signal recognition particle-docking protein FtsY [Acidobacteriota bacterium]
MSIFNYKEQPGYFARLKEALTFTKNELVQKVEEVVQARTIDEELLEELESVLIGSDIGVATTLEIIEKIRQRAARRELQNAEDVKALIRKEILFILQSVQNKRDYQPTFETSRARPWVLMVIGVNGVGKTTTIGKIAARFARQGQTPVICASDTFRAAAIEQLGIWAERTGAELVKQHSGADPSAVLFDAIAAARSRNREVLIVDTAGRLHTKSNLMQELDKMKRIAGREVPGAPHEVLLVLDATTGQNGLPQAREFLKTAGVTGLVITKLDGTAKGGIVVAIAKELAIPIRYIGVGEKIEDLMEFSPEAFVDSLFGAEQPVVSR